MAPAVWRKVEAEQKQFSATVKEKWGRLTDDEIAERKGKREQLEAFVLNVFQYWRTKLVFAQEPGLRRGKQELAARTLTPLILVRIQVPQPQTSLI
jgi:uncharacterized protein YjbJ (UPF0337 family)